MDGGVSSTGPYCLNTVFMICPSSSNLVRSMPHRLAGDTIRQLYSGTSPFTFLLFSVSCTCKHTSEIDIATDSLLQHIQTRKPVGFMQSCCADDVRTHMSSSSEISPEVSFSCHQHVVCTRFQPQKYFQLNSRATALLKIMRFATTCIPLYLSIIRCTDASL